MLVINNFVKIFIRKVMSSDFIQKSDVQLKKILTAVVHARKKN